MTQPANEGQIPSSLPPLPELPAGYTRWKYHGKSFDKASGPMMFAWPDETAWWPVEGWPGQEYGMVHYISAVAADSMAPTGQSAEMELMAGLKEAYALAVETPAEPAPAPPGGVIPRGTLAPCDHDECGLLACKQPSDRAGSGVFDIAMFREATLLGCGMSLTHRQCRELFKSVDELEREARRLQWQPIESAPRDGTAILAMLPDSDMPAIIRWTDATGMAYAPCWFIVWDGEHLGKYSQPTMWMHLPALAGKGAGL